MIYDTFFRYKNDAKNTTDLLLAGYIPSSKQLILGICLVKDLRHLTIGCFYSKRTKLRALAKIFVFSGRNFLPLENNNGLA